MSVLVSLAVSHLKLRASDRKALTRLDLHEVQDMIDVALCQHDDVALAQHHDLTGFQSDLVDVSDSLSNAVKVHTSVEHLLDEAEHHEIALRVATTASAPLRIDQRGTDQMCARPVVQLSVRDLSEFGNLTTAETF